MKKHFTINSNIMKVLPLIYTEKIYTPFKNITYGILLDPSDRNFPKNCCYVTASDVTALKVNRMNAFDNEGRIKVVGLTFDIKTIAEDAISIPVFPLSPTMYIGIVKELEIIYFKDVIIINAERYWQEGEERKHKF